MGNASGDGGPPPASLRTLGSTTESENLFARGLVAGRFRSRGWDWVGAKLAIASAWLPEQQADFLASLSFEPRTWALLEPMDAKNRPSLRFRRNYSISKTRTIHV